MLDSWLVGFGIEYSDGGAVAKVAELAKATKDAGVWTRTLTRDITAQTAAFLGLDAAMRSATAGYGGFGAASRAAAGGSGAAATAARAQAGAFWIAAAAANAAAAAMARAGAAAPAGPVALAFERAPYSHRTTQAVKLKTLWPEWSAPS